MPKLCVVSLSRTFAGRDLTLWRLKSHISELPHGPAKEKSKWLGHLMALIQINLVTPWTGSGGYSENRVAQRLTSMNCRNTQAFFALDRKRNFAKSDRRPLYPVKLARLSKGPAHPSQQPPNTENN